MNSPEQYEKQRFLDPLRRRIGHMVRRALLALIKDDKPVQVVQLNVFAGECRDGVERLQEYGLSTVPLPGGQALVVCVDGECAHGVVVATDDRRYRPRNQPPGSVMIYTNANKKDGKEDGADSEHHISLDPDERRTRARAKTIIFDADEMIEFRTAGGKNIIRIGDENYGIYLSQGGGFDNGGSEILMRDGKIWKYAAEKLITRTKVNRTENPPIATSEQGEPTMPE